MRRVAALVFGICQLSGCISYRYVTSSVAKPRPPNCPIRLLTVFSPDDYDQLGFLELSTGQGMGAEAIRDEAAKDICAAGGDALAPEINGRGDIFRAAVLKRRGR
jgi:hypothetical protein